MRHTSANTLIRPASRPSDPRFGSGPCRKHPGWEGARLDNAIVGRSHRSIAARAQLQEAMERARALLGVPDDWAIGTVPGSGTGAFEVAIWNLLGPRPVDVVVTDGFSGYWARRIQSLMPRATQVHSAPVGELPELSGLQADHDLVFVWNGTNTGVRFPVERLNPNHRRGLVIADATSAAFALPLDLNRVDVLTWSWQKALGGEGGQGVITLSPRALERLRSVGAPRSAPKTLALYDSAGEVLGSVFRGRTISTPSMLVVEDLHLALDWAESLGGVGPLVERVQNNHAVVAHWIASTPWLDWIAQAASYRSPVSLCFRIVPAGIDGALRDPQRVQDSVVTLLERERVAYDIWPYGNTPPSLRIWAGPTVPWQDLEALTKWLDWAYATCQHGHHSSGASWGHAIEP